MVGWVGDDLRDIDTYLYSDSSFADAEAMKSTCGLHVCLRGRNACFPSAGQSLKQDCVSSSTTESELVTAHFGIMDGGIPVFDSLSTILGLEHLDLGIA
jgi:hypothetical protein